MHHARVKKASTPKRPVAARKSMAGPRPKASPRPKHGARADLGAPVDGFFARQPPALRAILDELRKLVQEAAPTAASSLKWGMPFYTLDGAMMCALGAHKAHVNLILSGPPQAFADPDRLLEGDARTGRHLELRTVDDLPRAAVRGWLRTAARLARAK
jgi:hypothetical protein